MGLRACRIVIDGEVVGTLLSGESDTYPIRPGKHSICIKIDWCRSNSIILTCESGERYCLRFWPKNALSTILATFLPWLFHPITLEKAGPGASESGEIRSIPRVRYNVRVLSTGLIIFIVGPELFYWVLYRESWSWTAATILGIIGSALVAYLTFLRRNS